MPIAAPDGCVLMRIGSSVSLSDRALVESAMAVADEPAGLASERFDLGDEFFAWLDKGEIASFGWVTRGPRWIGGARMAQRPDRAFLFNFHTRKTHRGRGLYPALLQTIRSALAEENVFEAIIDVNDQNVVSSRAIAKAGFSQIAWSRHWCLLGRWQVLVTRGVLNVASEPVFE